VLIVLAVVRCTCQLFTCQFAFNRPGDNDETAMTVLSTLRQRSNPALARFASTYAAHRPVIQRVLTAGFIANFLVATLRSLSTRPSPPSTSKGKAREQSSYEAGKSPRVAVCTYLFRLALLVSLFCTRSMPCSIRGSLGSSGS
jgi:hypothetical protein